MKIRLIIVSIFLGMLMLLTIACLRQPDKEPAPPANWSIRVIEKQYIGDNGWIENVLGEYPNASPYNFVGTLPIRNITAPEGYLDCGRVIPPRAVIDEEGKYKIVVDYEKNLAVRTCFVRALRENHSAFMESRDNDEEGWVSVTRTLFHNQTTPIIEVFRDSEEPSDDGLHSAYFLYYTYSNTTCTSFKEIPQAGGITVSFEDCTGPWKPYDIWLS